MNSLEVNLRVPDLWQQAAIRALQEGADVVVDAPTGAGKTYIFELLIDNNVVGGQAVYTVPTRALANDKLLDWRDRNWNVGIATGDLAEKVDAPVLVATLETQKSRLLQGDGPALLVIDEYQMIADATRGVNYELAIASAPPETQILMLSGSVGNPQSTVDWLRRLGRQAVLVSFRERPVPLEEVHGEGLPGRIPDSVRGFWPRLVAKALKNGMGPILAFAPRRKSAESLAYQLASVLPEEDPIELTAEQRRLAGDDLTRLLRARIAYHHSGLDYRQRAGLVEPLAKAGQLRVVVATMGLASGINFSLRSVFVTDREYRAGDIYHLVRPDELLQMFGRAGRRGLDKRGYIIVAKGKPRLSEARPLQLKRTRRIDWPSMLALMHHAVEEGQDPRQAANQLARRLFSDSPIDLGFDKLSREVKPNAKPARKPHRANGSRVHMVIEILNSEEKWERRRAPVQARLGACLVREQEGWRPNLRRAGDLRNVGVGAICKLKRGKETRYGRELPLARLGRDESEGELVLTKWLHQHLREHTAGKHNVRRRRWTIEELEKFVLPLLPAMTEGGKFHSWHESTDIISARLDYAEKTVFALVDSFGQALLDPPEREINPGPAISFREAMGVVEKTPDGTDTQPPAVAWQQLGLIEANGHPTRRGVIFSYFNHGEGLAIAAALEEATYPIHELVFDLANLRAGHRFDEHEESSGRLGSICRLTYAGATHEGYLQQGIPPGYGDGAAELLQEIAANRVRPNQLTGEELRTGDIERARLEWRSLLNHTAHAPDYPWERWRDLRLAARQVLDTLPQRGLLAHLPPLTPIQRERHKSFLRFD